MSVSELGLEAQDHDNFDVQGAWRRLYGATWQHKWIVFLTTLMTIAIVVAYIFIWPPVFESQVGFMVERDNDAARDTFYTGWAIFRKDDIETENVLMISGPILEDVARELELSYDEVYHTFLGWAKHLWRESWLGKKYKEVRETLFPRPPSKYDPTDEEIEFGKVLHDFQKGVSIQRIGESYVGLLTVKASSPRAAEIANAIFDRYREERILRHVEEANRAHETLVVEDAKVRQELQDKEDELRVFLEENEIVFDFERAKIEMGKWIDMRATLVGAESSLADIDARLQVLDGQLSAEERQMVGSRAFEQNRLRRELEMTRIRHETALVESLNRYHPEAPEVANLERTIASLTERIEAASEMVPASHTEVMNSTYETMRSKRLGLLADRSGVLASRGVLSEAEREIGERLASVPGKRTAFEVYMRDVGQLRNKYLNVHTRLIQSEVTRTTVESTMPSLRLVEYATPSGDPAWPRTKLLLLTAGCVGLLLGIGAALLRDIFLGQVRIEDVRDGRGAAAFYAHIPVGVDRSLFDLGPPAASRARGGSA